MRRAALLAASLLTARGASAAALDAFVDAFTPSGVSVLADRGYLVVQGGRGSRRLAAVHWKALEALAEAAPSCRRLSEPPAEGPDGLGPCRALPFDGAMTPRLHLLACAAAAESEERWSLSASSSALAEPAGLKNLFETPWGVDLARRRRADRLEDPASLVKPFFAELLAGPKPDAEAIKHFLAVTTAHGVSGANAKLAEDAARGAASEELRAMIRRYLHDERSRRGLALARERAAALLADKETRRELSELEALSAVLAAQPGLIASLEAAVSAAPAPAGAPRLRLALHLQEPTRLGQYELGDQAVVSGAYWVDGLAEGASVEVEESTFLETARGFSSLETVKRKLSNGGPYSFARRITVEQSRAFSLLAAVSAASGSAVSERVEIPVAPDYGLAVEKEAEALQLSLSCDPKAAEAAYAALEALVAEAAKVKPQYQDLLERSRKGRAQAAADVESLVKLEEALDASRADASPQQCRYETARTDAAISLARKLPPGCDRVLPELFSQRAAVSRRAADQVWFLKASSEARARRRACDLQAAAERWTQSLSVLETDPAARCGKTAEEARRAEDGLAAVLRSLAWTEVLDKALDQAEAATVPAKRLEAVRPALARLASLEDRECRREALKRARRLAAQAGEDETGPADADLPREATLTAALGEVRRARSRLLETYDVSAQPAAAPASPTPAPEAKPKSAAKKQPPAKKAPR
ncbi:MAG TPA: hypothetical protein DCZ01_11025 [Elusimicrobia bacterium]|nr:MAG: hypothetical protein A2X37_02015 [Elusimicrobia bacterium GWA2_66_18]OGR77435.1 MAG: hypothetical protein A2X40_11290 [Elusimicrobia bacterium GWC2_65_9]HAZ09023.1 hypothetical protein [Elusimicrobiota bacterium]